MEHKKKESSKKKRLINFSLWSVFLIFVSIRIECYAWLLVIPLLFDLYITKKVLRNKIFKTVFWMTVYTAWTIWIGNYFLLLGLPIVFDLYYSKKVNWTFWKPRDPAKNTFVTEWVDAIIFAVVAASIIRMFLIEAFTIPTSSMEKSMLVGDYLFVSKYHYGPKLPNTPLSFPFVHHTLPLTKQTPSYLEWIKMPYKRLAGLEPVKRNDIVVFNFPEGDTVCANLQAASYYSLVRQISENYAMQTNTPYNENFGRKQLLDNEIYGKILVRPVDKKENYIKRCVGVPGDSIKIIDGQMYINGKAQEHFDDMQYNYYLATDGQSINSKFVEKYGISQEDLAGAQRFMASPADLDFVRNHPQLSQFNTANLFMLPLTQDKVDRIKKNPFIKAIVKSIKPQGQYNSGVFPHTPKLYAWNEDNFGSLYIPKAGDTTPLNKTTLPLYKRIIQVYEKNDLKVVGDNIYINGELATTYTFKMNYYWLMGDNRHNSADSRFWGYVPEDHVVGKALMIWFSSDKDQSFPSNIRWDRILTMIH